MLVTLGKRENSSWEGMSVIPYPDNSNDVTDFRFPSLYNFSKIGYFINSTFKANIIFKFKSV